mgnify:CR=1 FL=1
MIRRVVLAGGGTGGHLFPGLAVIEELLRRRSSIEVLYVGTERGIEASAPDLKTVEDLEKYASVFPDPEGPGMGRIFGGIPGWEVTEILEKKVEAYGLTEMYNYVMPGSDIRSRSTPALEPM